MSNTSLDLLVESAVIHGQLKAGVSPAVVASRTSLKALVPAAARDFVQGCSPAWTQAEDDFLRQHLGRLHEAEIARRLGRTVIAVHLRWKRDLRLPAPSKSPDVLTANQIANGMGMDLHTVASWIDRGLLPGRRLPMKDVTRVVGRVAFLCWLVNPENWPLFKPERVGGNAPMLHRGAQCYDQAFWAKARRLVELAQARWGDEWWTTRQAADYHGVDSQDVHRYIQLGRLSGVHVRNLSGRHGHPRWSPWFVRRSEVQQLVFKFGKGSGHELPWSEPADVFLILAKAIGLSTNAINAMCGYTTQRISYRLGFLRNKKRIPGLIRKYGLKVEYNSRTGALFADWKDYRGRFPRVARAMQRLRAGHELNRRDLCDVRGVLQSWAEWHGRTREQKRFARSLITVGTRQARHFHALVAQMRGWADPFRR